MVTPEHSVDSFCNVLKVVANPNRLKILTLLLQGEQSVGEIELKLGIKQPNLSNDLGKLRQKQLVQTRKQSKIVFYKLADESTQIFIEHIIDALELNRDLGKAPAVIKPRSNRADYKVRSIKRDGECGKFSIVHSILRSPV